MGDFDLHVLWDGVASRTAYASKLNFEIFPVRSGAKTSVSLYRHEKHASRVILTGEVLINLSILLRDT